jgi:2-oxoglutarate dehydrogenase E1 component
MTPKSLLRHKKCVSSSEEFTKNTTFMHILPDSEDFSTNGKLAKDSDIKRVVLCSGKIYYDLLEERATGGSNAVYLLRLEQLYPFPGAELASTLARFPQAEIVWCQEEPKNQGVWQFINNRIMAILKATNMEKQEVRYIGRAEIASTATGLMSCHIREQKRVSQEAVSL